MKVCTIHAKGTCGGAHGDCHAGDTRYHGGMSLLSTPRTVKWPFFAGDALLIGLAWFLYTQAKLPMNAATLAACVACVALGAVLGIAPFILDYRAEVRLAEAAGLADTIGQIQNLEAVATAVKNATGSWQSAHQHAREAVNAAREVSEKMNAEMQNFLQFFEKANNSERQHLSLEVDKLRRAESEWLGVLVRILDHVFAIHSAARRAGQERVLEQLTQFQLACRDAARRVGLTPFEVEPGAAVDPKKHRLPSGDEPQEGARVAETMATGFTFRGQMIRPAMVTLEGDSEAPEPTTAGEGGPGVSGARDQEGDAGGANRGPAS